MNDGRYLGLLDMLDGGGAGRAGQTFQGGPLSGLLNALGIRPMGYRDRLAAAAPMAPAGLGAAPRPAPPPTSPVTTTPLIGSLTPDDILAAISRGTPPPPYRQPTMPPPQRMPTLQEIMEADRFRRERDAAMSFERSGIFRGM